MRRILTVLSSLLLTACVEDAATYAVDGNEHTLTVRAQQAYFWDEEVTLTLLASHLPDCQRRHALTGVTPDEVNVELFASGDSEWVLRQGKQLWRIETRNCTQLAVASKTELGERIGSFKLRGDKMVFEATGRKPAAAVPPGAE